MEHGNVRAWKRLSVPTPLPFESVGWWPKAYCPEFYLSEIYQDFGLQDLVV
jgi:hypothetical protein